MIIRRSAYVEKNSLSSDAISRIRTELTLYNQDENATRQVMRCYEEDDAYLKVPKQYGLNLAVSVPLAITDKQVGGKDVGIAFRGELRAYQHSIVETARRHLEESQGGTLVLPCGAGKTVCALRLSCLFGKKTLILVHTEVLLRQWEARIHEFITGASVGIIRQSVVDVQNRTHVIAMMQTIYRKEIAPDIIGDFGLLIVDEAHHVCAEMLSRCVDKVGTKLRLGLSATPYRRDGFHDFLFWSLGPICFEGKRDDTEKLLVHAVTLGTSVKIHKTYRNGGTSINLAKMITDLTTKDTRTQQVIALIQQEACAERRKILVLADRRQFLQDIANTVTSHPGIVVGTLFGGASGKKGAQQMHHALTCNVIFATYPYVAEGFDMPSLDTVVLATPRSDVVQVVGRIQRTFEGKQRPLVIDLIDGGVFWAQFRKREKFYESIHAEIVHTKYGEPVEIPSKEDFPFTKRLKIQAS
jgi:superfamily II DNA or RNA helicase